MGETYRSSSTSRSLQKICRILDLKRFLTPSQFYPEHFATSYAQIAPSGTANIPAARASSVIDANWIEGGIVRLDAPSAELARPLLLQTDHAPFRPSVSIAAEALPPIPRRACSIRSRESPGGRRFRLFPPSGTAPLPTSGGRAPKGADAKLGGHTWNKSFRERRCLIPASAFFEWVQRPGGMVPLRFERPDDHLIFITGIWREEQDRGEYFSMITTEQRPCRPCS